MKTESLIDKTDAISCIKLLRFGNCSTVISKRTYYHSCCL